MAVGLGPRVGGAHVETNLSFDPKSVSQVGKQIHDQLEKLSSRIQSRMDTIAAQNRRFYQGIGRDAVTAWRSLLGLIVSSAPLMGSAISGVAGAATMLAGALYSSVQSAYALAPLLTAIGVAAGTARIGFDGFFAAISSGDFEGLTPSAEAAARAVRSLGDEWKRVSDTVQERMFAGLADDISRLGTTLLPVLQRGLGKMADSLNGLFQSLLDYVNSKAGLKQINAVLENSADIFKRLSRAAVPFLDGLLRLLNALAPAGKRLADRITDIAERFQSWTKAEGFGKRIDDMMKRAEKTAGLLFKVLGNLGAALANIFNAANPATNTFLQMLVDVTQRFRDWTSSVEGEESIAKWASQSVDVMRQLGKTLESVFKVVSELADPRVIISFLETVEGAFDHLGKLPLEAMVDGFVRIAEALQPVSSLFLAIIIAAAGFNIVIGSVLGQLGGLFSVLGRMVKPLAGLFKPLAGAGKHSKELTGLAAAFGRIGGTIGKFFGPLASAGKRGKELTGLAAAFGRIAGVVGRFAKFIPFVGWAVWIGMVIAKSEDLQKKVGELWDAIKGFGSSIATAFKEIGEALAPLAPVATAIGTGLGWVFDLLDEGLILAVGQALSSLTHIFSGLGETIEGLGKIIAGVINVLVGLFTLDGDKILKGFEQLGSGLLKIFLGLGEVLLAPTLAMFETLGTDVVDGLMNGLKSVGSRIADFGRWIVDGVKSVLGISSPSTVFAEIGRWIVIGLINGIRAAAGGVVTAFQFIVTRVLGVVSRLPGRLLNLGARAVGQLASAVIGGASRVITGAARIVTGVVTRVALLPGQLLALGQQAVTRLAGALSAGVGRLRTIAGNIASGIVGAVKSLPGQMLKIGANIIGSLISGLTSQLGKLKGVADSIGGVIKNVLPGSPVKEGPLKAWNRGGGATGGGQNVIDAITAGLRDTSPIRKAMNDVANAVASSLTPTVGAGSLGTGGSVTNSRSLSLTIQNPVPETGSESLTRTARNLAYLGLV